MASGTILDRVEGARGDRIEAAGEGLGLGERFDLPSGLFPRRSLRYLSEELVPPAVLDPYFLLRMNQR